MSDEFDKEAEREKLREKFEADRRDREHTQRMSELLLQGATMTNRHCETCGDPIFSHEGREFCPTCHATEDGYEIPADGAGPEGNASENGSTANEPSVDETAGSGSTEGGAVRSGDPRAAGDPAATRTGDATTAPNDAPTPSNDTSTPPNDTTTAPNDTSTPPNDTTTAPNDAPSPPNDASGSDRAFTEATNRPPATTQGVDDARASLTRTLTRFARAAESADDPKRARDHLAAAREAAETLSALDG